ncbi:hypothetical protein [Alkaliphilus oremlandii]|uniref:Uncharacterized protein n=1 Tax=Alkaliphilus oremlandii (strain OhILAs) TaxID=350688 RepID=A8MLY6_ALKOO|nr:hypothetical protein [Alkaliphilus oremlandii]ABW18153.1 hypothetical protein Clos_0591 [Alkaliphilus oremlandii OhILAs]
MKFDVDKELIEVQIKYIQKEISMIEMVLRNKDYDTLDFIILQSNYEVDLGDTATLEERLNVYKSWYEQVLYLLFEYEEENESLDDDILVVGIDY